MSEAIWIYDKDAIFRGECYSWIAEEMGAPDGDGWYDSEWAKVTKSFPQGTGIYLNCPTEGAYLAYSGEVDSESQEHELALIGFNVIGNSSPVDIDLQDIKLIGAVGDMSEAIWIYDKDAIFRGECYSWIVEEMGAPDGNGWYDSEWAKVIKTVKAGEGLYLNCPTEGVKWTVPGPIKPATAD